MSLPDILMNGEAVYAEVQRLRNNNHQTSPHNVADVLDAIASLMRKEHHVPTMRIQPAPASILPAAPRPVWLDPAEYPPPSGKLHILTGGGIATTGHWDDKDCVAWMPLADTPDSVKQRINNWYRKAGQPQ